MWYTFYNIFFNFISENTFYRPDFLSKFADNISIKTIVIQQMLLLK